MAQMRRRGRLPKRQRYSTYYRFCDISATIASVQSAMYNRLPETFSSLDLGFASRALFFAQRRRQQGAPGRSARRDAERHAGGPISQITVYLPPHSCASCPGAMLAIGEVAETAVDGREAQPAAAPAYPARQLLALAVVRGMSAMEANRWSAATPLAPPSLTGAAARLD